MRAHGRIAVMQGRLVPQEDHRIQCFPASQWRDEFPRAACLGLAAIEWIYERFGAEANPLRDAGVWAEVRALSDRWEVGVRSVCADILMDEPIVRVPAEAAERASAHLEWLLARSADVGAERVVLPFVGANALRTAEEIRVAEDYIQRWAATAGARGVELHLETSLGPRDFAALLARNPSRWVKAAYDVGNSLIFGFDIREELAAYGERVGSVHIKDAVRGQSTVPLGTGDADFGFCFERFGQLGYKGPFVLQAARVAGEDDVETVGRYVAFVERCLGGVDGTASGGSGPRG